MPPGIRYQNQVGRASYSGFSVSGAFFFKMEGWIKIHRQIKENWIWDDPLYLKAWLGILLTVNHEDKKVLIQGELIECKRGQSILSLAGWAKCFGKKWTMQRVRTFFELLKRDQMIITEGLRKTTRLTVCKYDDYQFEQQAKNKQRTSKEHPENKLTTTNKNEEEEIKNEDNVKNEESGKPMDFIDRIISEFVCAHGDYEVMNRGKERTAAAKILKLFKRKYPNADSEKILTGLRVFFESCIDIPDPWLHDRMSLSLIESKFNEIKIILKNGTAKRVGTTNQELITSLAKSVGADFLAGAS